MVLKILRTFQLRCAVLAELLVRVRRAEQPELPRPGAGGEQQPQGPRRQHLPHHLRHQDRAGHPRHATGTSMTIQKYFSFTIKHLQQNKQ